MNIKRTTVISVMVDENTELKVGDYAMFIANGVCMAGTYRGLTTRGALAFDDKVAGRQISFNIMPKSIECIEIVFDREDK